MRGSIFSLLKVPLTIGDHVIYGELPTTLINKNNFQRCYNTGLYGTHSVNKSKLPCVSPLYRLENVVSTLHGLDSKPQKHTQLIHCFFNDSEVPGRTSRMPGIKRSTPTRSRCHCTRHSETSSSECHMTVLYPLKSELGNTHFTA